MKTLKEMHDLLHDKEYWNKTVQITMPGEHWYMILECLAAEEHELTNRFILALQDGVPKTAFNVKQNAALKKQQGRKLMEELNDILSD